MIEARTEWDGAAERRPGGAAWWQGAVVYQIYPRSFADGNGDGVGDLIGARRRLPYLADLGVDAVWLSPFYPSPMRDFGYDVTDHTGVDPLFGTLGDFDALLARAHALGLRVIVDFVPNHTSDEHAWFAASRASREGERADWYVWADPAPGGGPPNNWRCVTGGSAWSFEPRRGQYYLHSFLGFQPDLDLAHPPVREALHAAMRFWLDRGVDGLRVDMIDFLAKDPLRRDEPDPGYRFADAVHHLNRPEIAATLGEMMAVLAPYGDRVMIGEINPELSIAQTVAYYGPADAPLMHLPFNFGLMRQPFEAEALGAFLAAYEAAVPPHGWPNHTLGNHDVPRLASRLGPANARLAAMLLLTLRGTPFLYQGDELGLTDVAVPPERAQDPWEAREPGRGRDPNRTPMPWERDAPQAGFSAAEPWLPIGAENVARAADGQAADRASLLWLARDLLGLRRRTAALRWGDQEIVRAEDGLLVYRRAVQCGTRGPADEALVLLNLSDRGRTVEDAPTAGMPALLAATDAGVVLKGGGLTLPPRAGAVLGRPA